MQTDPPTNPVAGEGQAPQPAPTGSAQPAADIKGLQDEIHQLRAVNREETALRLGAQFGLDAPTVGLLKTIDRDKQEEAARQIAAARQPQPGAAAAPASTPQVPAPVSSAPDAVALAAIASAGHGSPVPVASTQKPEEQLEARLAAATSLSEMAVIQRQMDNQRRDALRASSIFQ